MCNHKQTKQDVQVGDCLECCQEDVKRQMLVNENEMLGISE